MSDLDEIKNKIYEENKIEQLLEMMGCQHIRERSNRYEAQLPERFESPNIRSVQVKKSPHLSCRVYSEGISSTSIFGLVAFIVLEAKEHEFSSKLYDSKKWICNTLGYNMYHNQSVEIKDADFGDGHNPLSWLKDLKKKRNKKQSSFTVSENPVLDESVLGQFEMMPYKPYIEAGIEYDTQVEFDIGIDIDQERIIFPIHNSNGQIISVKGRTMIEDYTEKEIGKFYHYFNFNKMIELYNWHRALPHILERKEILIFEAEKSCWLSTQFGLPHCVALGGSDITKFQVDKIKELGIEIKIVFCMDKDKNTGSVGAQCKKFGINRLVYGMIDEDDLLGEKESPVDKGKDIFLKMYMRRFDNRLNK